MNSEELKKITEAVHVLRKHFGGIEWKIAVSEKTEIDPSDFSMTRAITVNETTVGRFDVALADDEKAKN